MSKLVKVIALLHQCVIEGFSLDEPLETYLPQLNEMYANKLILDKYN